MLSQLWVLTPDIFSHERKKRIKVVWDGKVLYCLFVWLVFFQVCLFEIIVPDIERGVTFLFYIEI